MEVSTTVLPLSKDLPFVEKVAGEEDTEIRFLLFLKDYAAIQVYQRL